MLSLSLGLSLTSGQGGGAPAELIDPTTLFDGDTGFIFDLSDGTSVFEERTIAATQSGNGDQIGTLKDLSGNDNHIIAPDDGSVLIDNRPNYVTDGSVGYANFVAASVEVLTATFTLSQPITFVCSFRINVQSDNDWPMDGGTSTSTVFYMQAGPVIRLYAGNLAASGQSFTIGENFVMTAIANGASSKWAVNSNAYTEGDAGANDAGGISFGAEPDGSGAVSMRLYRAIGIGRVLTDEEITAARAWCAAPAGVSL